LFVAKSPSNPVPVTTGGFGHFERDTVHYSTVTTFLASILYYVQ
jgi:hypothetical protein